MWHLELSCEVAATLRRLRRAVPGMSDDAFLRGAAGKTRSSTGPGGKSGALGQFRGHLFERLDVEIYNLRRAGTGRSLRLRSHAYAPGYDADRFIKGRYAGSVQHKLGPRNVVAAATKAERLKNGSATRATVRVPKDRAAEAIRNAAGKIRVQASDITSFAVERRGDAGLKQLASLGEAAVSGVHQAGRAAGWAAVVSVAIGSLGDVKLLLRGELTGASFAAARAVDAAEAGVCAAATVGAGAAIGSAMCALAAGTGTVAVGAGLVASSTVVVPVATGVVVGVVIGRTSRPIRRRIVEWGRRQPAGRHLRPTSSSSTMPPWSAIWSSMAGPSWRERWAASTRLGSPFLGNLWAVTSPDSASLAGPHTAPDLVQQPNGVINDPTERLPQYPMVLHRGGWSDGNWKSPTQQLVALTESPPYASSAAVAPMRGRADVLVARHRERPVKALVRGHRDGTSSPQGGAATVETLVSQGFQAGT